MRKALAGLFTAFSLYSAIPTPKTDWNRENIRFALCYFPLIGVVIAVLHLWWYRLCAQFGFEPGLYAAVAVLLPLLVSGGIHMDGFVDTADALCSHALREKKLEILKDPHVGAFGVLWCGCGLLLSYGLWQQLYQHPLLLPLVLGGYVLSRCANAASIASFPTAKQSGLVYLFHRSADKRVVLSCNIVIAAVVLLCFLIVSPLWGGGAAALSVGYFFFHRRLCISQFGGNTGDLAGFLLQNLETLLLVVAAVGGALA